MNSSILRQLSVITVVAMLLVATVGGAAWIQFSRVMDNDARAGVLNAALRYQMDADMMHDAIRGDALSALHAALRKDAEVGAEAQKQMTGHAKHFRTQLGELRALTLPGTAGTAVVEIVKPLDEYIAAGESIMKTVTKDVVAAEAQYPVFLKAFEVMEGELSAVTDSIEEASKVTAAENVTLVTQFQRLVMVTLLGSLITLILLTVWVGRRIPLVFANVIRDLSGISTEASNTSSRVAQASQLLAEGASQQAASLEETSASLEEISAMTKSNADNVDAGKKLGTQARQSTAAGLDRINELTLTLVAIKSAVGEMQTSVGEMQSSSAEIAKIIKTIDEIAFQTNLLALNAAVEAARAGDAGAGFAVVADEVRALAQRSAQAAKDISEMIEASVKRSALGGAASNKVVQSLVEVDATAQSIQQVFNGISSQIKSLDEVIGEIATASQEQSRGINEVNLAVSHLDKVTQANAIGSQENASSSEELNEQAATLQTVVGQLQSIVAGGGSRPGPWQSNGRKERRDHKDL